MVLNRAVTLAPPDLRLQFVEGVDDLAQLDDAKLPELARVIVYKPDPLAIPPNAFGGREFVFTRLPLPAANPITFTDYPGGYTATANKNIYVSKSGDGLWIQAPQLLGITLNGVTPVVVADVATIVGDTTPEPLGNFMWHRSGLATAVGQPLITLQDNQISVVSDNANDDGNIFVQLFTEFVYA